MAPIIKRRNHPVGIDDDTVRRISGMVDIPDVLHPDRIDWRRACLAIDIVEGRYHHLSFLENPGGRAIDDLVRCPAIEAQLAYLLNTLYDMVLPGRTTSELRFPEMSLRHFSLDERLALSFHVNAKSQAAIRKLSNHQCLSLQQTWDNICAAQARKRAAPAL